MNAKLDLQNGRIDGVFGDTAVVTEWLKDNHGLARDAAQLCAGQRRKHGGAVFIPKRNRHNTKT